MRVLDPESRLYLVRAEKARSARDAAIERQLNASRPSAPGSREPDRKLEPMATLRRLLRQPAGA